MVVFRSKTGDPKDTYVNNFIFRNDAIASNPDSVATGIRSHLEEFYSTPAPAIPGQPAVQSIAHWMAGPLFEPTVEVKVYDLGQPKGQRFPLDRSFTITWNNERPMPPECALVLSTVANMNRPRHRGRIFIGPLRSGAGDANNGRFTALPTVMNTILGAAERLRQKSSALTNPTNAVTWVVASEADRTTREITGFWVDNAFDTQRRRGFAATERRYIGSYLGAKGVSLNG